MWNKNVPLQHTHLVEPLEQRLVGARQHREALLVREEDGGRDDRDLDRLAAPPVDLCGGRQVGGELERHRQLLVAVAQQPQCVPPGRTNGSPWKWVNTQPTAVNSRYNSNYPEQINILFFSTLFCHYFIKENCCFSMF